MQGYWDICDLTVSLDMSKIVERQEMSQFEEQKHTVNLNILQVKFDKY